MTKIILVKRIEEDWYGCYYESDRPTHDEFVIGYCNTLEEGYKISEEYHKIHGKQKQATGYGKGIKREVGVDYEYEEIEIPKDIIKSLWEKAIKEYD